ncbi:hypothetical protein C8J57DRAFT_1233797 [Mycena rebaudengoi]|nr:hypothetical protein C8J57DRAFT_1233797 [Mycena rebaudengoi]
MVSSTGVQKPSRKRQVLQREASRRYEARKCVAGKKETLDECAHHLEVAAKYREMELRKLRNSILKEGTEAFDIKVSGLYTMRMPKKHKGCPPTRRPPHLEKKPIEWLESDSSTTRGQLLCAEGLALPEDEGVGWFFQNSDTWPLVLAPPYSVTPPTRPMYGITSRTHLFHNWTTVLVLFSSASSTPQLVAILSLKEACSFLTEQLPQSPGLPAMHVVEGEAQLFNSYMDTLVVFNTRLGTIELRGTCSPEEATGFLAAEEVLALAALASLNFENELGELPRLKLNRENGRLRDE